MKHVLTCAMMATGLAFPSAFAAEETEKTAPLPVVIELVSVSSDTIPFSSVHDTTRGRDIVAIDGSVLRIHPDIMRSLIRREQTSELAFDEAVKELSDVKAVILKNGRFDGNYRRGSTRRIELRSKLPDFPEPVDIDEVTITPAGPEPSIARTVVWPDAGWELTEEEGDKPESLSIADMTLNPGEQHTLEPAELDLDVSVAAFKPAKIGDDSGKLDIVTESLGRHQLKSTVTVRFLGRLSLEEARR